MKDQKTKKLAELHQRVAELEAAETERQRAEEALWESKELFEKAFVNQRDAILLLDASVPPTILDCNPAAMDVFGYTRQEMLGRTMIWLHVNETTLKEFQELLYPAIKECGFLHLPEFNMRRKDGTVFPAELNVAPLKDKQGKQTGWVSVIRDITERKQAEERTKHLNAVLRAIRSVNQLIVREKDRDRLLQGACDSLIETRGYYNAWIALIDESGRLVATAEAGLGQDFLPLVERLERCETTYCIRMALARAGVLIIEDPLFTCIGCPLSSKYGGRGGMAVRLEHAGKVYGLLIVSVSAGILADEEERSLFREAAGDIALALRSIELEEERKQTEEALKRRAAQLALINDIGGKIAAVLDLDSVLDRAAHLMQESFGYHHVALFTLDRERGELVMRARAGAFTDLFPSDHRLKLGQGIVGWVSLHGQRLLANDVDAEPRYVNLYPDVIPTRSELSMPIRVGREVVGVLDVQSPQLNAFDENDVMVMETLADQIAVAIENARLYEAVRQELAERKRVVGALRESEERYRRLVEFSPEAITVHSEGKIIYINAAGVKLFGAASSEELIGKLIIDFIHPDYQEIVKERVRQSYEQGKVTLPIEERVIQPDGQVIDVETAAVSITYQGKPAALTVARDITERKRTEEALRAAEAKYRMLVEQLPAIIYIVELGKVNRTIYISPQVESLLGFSQTEWLADPDLWIEQLHPDDRERVLSEVRRKDASGEPLDLEYRVLARDGRVLWFRNQTVLVRDETGQIRYSHGVMFDITERKQLETQFRQAQKMETLGSLAAGIAHDFNNLLTPIGGFATLLLRKAPESSQQQEYLRYIQVAAERAAALTRQLRLFTRQEEGERHPIQLNSVVEETHDLLEHSIPKEIAIELSLASDLWVVEADPSQISQVLINLGLNARDAMPDGGTLTLETRNVALNEEYARKVLAARPGRYVCLSVSDTGCGMSPEVQARLFEPFFTTKEKGKGTGLGLSVVYGIVKGHSGFINVYSQEEQGSTFRVYLPAIELAVEGTEVKGLALPTGTETILLVDDEEMVLELGQGVLGSCGYTVLTAENGVQALEVYQAHRGEIALVVLDLVMPEMSGQECLRRLREMAPQVKVLFSTGYMASGLAQELVAEGALGVVEKPFLLQDFAIVVRAALDQS